MTILRAQEREAKLLGLDPPTRVEPMLPVVPSMTDEEADAILRELPPMGLTLVGRQAETSVPTYPSRAQRADNEGGPMCRTETMCVLAAAAVPAPCGRRCGVAMVTGGDDAERYDSWNGWCSADWAFAIGLGH